MQLLEIFVVLIIFAEYPKDTCYSYFTSVWTLPLIGAQILTGINEMARTFHLLYFNIVFQYQMLFQIRAPF